MKILGTGLSGLVGSYVTQTLGDLYEFENLSLETGVDITNEVVVREIFKTSTSNWVLHFAAKTDVDGAEKEKELGENSATWIVNVKATGILVKACQDFGKKMLYISTDFVFPGGDQIFKEEDSPNPIGWYAQTKYEGEKLVQGLGKQGLITRIAYPYGAVNSPRPDFVLKIAHLLNSNQTVASPIDQIFTPTYLGDIAAGIKILMENNESGIYHLVGSKSLSSFDAAHKIAKVFNLPESLITKTTVADFYKERSPRAFHLMISSDRIKKLGVSALDFESGLQVFYKLLQKHKIIY